MLVLSHSPAAFLSGWTANVAPSQAAARVLRASGLLRSSSRKAVRRHSSAALCRSAHFARSTLAAVLAGRLNKTCILSPSSRRFSPQLRRWVARSARSVPPAAAHSRRLRRLRNNRPSLRVAVQITHQQGHITASRICRYGSIAAAHGRYCKFACIAEQRIFSSPCAVLSAHNAEL